MDSDTSRNSAEGQTIAWLYLGISPRPNGISHLKPQRGENVALLTIHIIY
jgi:hypothetical protein